MPVYLVAYQLNYPGKDYAGLEGQLRSSAAFHPLAPALGLVYSPETADELLARLARSLDTNDLLIAAPVGECVGWLPAESHRWLAEHLRAARGAAAPPPDPPT